MSEKEVKGEAVALADEERLYQEEKETGKSVVALTEEQRWKRRFDKVNADFEEWERNHPGYNVLNPEYIQFNQLLNDAERRWKDARAMVEKAIQLGKVKENGPKKKKRRVDVLVAYQGPVPKEYCCVPMDTITTYQHLLLEFQRPSDEFSRPLYLLYGPRQFGKTTVALRLGEEIVRDPSIEFIYYRVDSLDIETEASFWGAIGKRIQVDITSSDELLRVINAGGKRLCLFLDEMDAMFENQSLTSNFISRLSSWQTATFFHGFLGIGSYDLVNLYKRFKGGGDRISPFNLSSVIKIEPFTDDQMVDFFDQLSMAYNFATSTRLAIMDYSSGAPGVFGSLIRFTIDRRMWTSNFSEWHSWFNIQNFTEYMLQYNTTYERIQNDLQQMGAEDWNALNYVLIRENASFANEFDFGHLLRMGVLTQATTGELRFSSAMMRRICMEAQPVREIDQVLSDDSPFELLSVSLRWMKPDVIGHTLVANREAPSEAFFQFELYASIRGIFQKHQYTRKVLAEARERGEKRRLDITISSGTTYGFELKSNKLTKADIEAAVRQADGYRRLLDIDTIFVVNFVPRSHLMDDIYHDDCYPNVKVIHVRFPDSCDEYELKFVGESGDVQSRIVRSIAI